MDWVSQIGARRGLAPVILALFAAVLFLPGLWSVPPVDRDEPRITQATKQMLETGNYIEIQFQDEKRYKRPVGVYWLQAAAAQLSGLADKAPLWVYRLPSTIGAIIAVLLVFWTARAFTGPPAAFAAAALVAMALVLGVEARLAKTDAVLFATVVAAQGALARVWLDGSGERQWRLAAIFWTALAVAVLVKGPIALMVVGLTILVLVVIQRRLGWIRGLAPLAGVAWLILLVSPWFIAMLTLADGAFFLEAVGRDFLGKVPQGQESHAAPPLTHLAVMLAVFWPLPAFVIIAIPRLWAERRSAVVVFCAVWFLPSWIVFELVATKLPHDTLPLLPALAIAAAAVLWQGQVTAGKAWLRWLAAIMLVVPIIGLTAVALGAPFFLDMPKSWPKSWPTSWPISWAGGFLAVAAAVFVLLGARHVIEGQPRQALPQVAASAVAMAIGAWAFFIPALTPIWISPRLVAAIEEVAPCPDPQVVIAGFREPSFIFLQGTDTRFARAGGAAAFLSKKKGACRMAIVDTRFEDTFQHAAKAAGADPRLVDRVQGININGGKKLDLGIYVKGDGAS